MEGRLRACTEEGEAGEVAAMVEPRGDDQKEDETSETNEIMNKKDEEMKEGKERMKCKNVHLCRKTDASKAERRS